MADSKITALTAISTVDPTADPLVIVDVSDTSMAASGTTKKSTINQLLGAGGTATLASATITGDLTVDTSTLKVDSANNRVGIGTASPATRLDVNGGTGGIGGQTHATFSGTAGRGLVISTRSDNVSSDRSGVFDAPFTGGTLAFQTLSTDRMVIDSTGVCVWSVGGSTAMTLNSTGLGVGVVPANNKLQVLGNIGIPNVCMAAGETNGVFTIDVANLFAQTGAVWRQCSFLLVYSGVDQNLGNSTVLQTVVTLQGLATWNTISKNDVVGVASVAVSLDTTTSARITVTVPTGNFGSAYVMLLGGVGPTTRPSVTINI
jgi:hypothetical protein